MTSPALQAAPKSTVVGHLFRCAKCAANKRVTWERVDGRPLFPPPPTCCGVSMRDVGPIRGKVNEDHECDLRCENARGLNCDCSCGGRNHGRAWA